MSLIIMMEKVLAPVRLFAQQDLEKKFGTSRLELINSLSKRGINANLVGIPHETQQKILGEDSRKLALFNAQEFVREKGAEVMYPLLQNCFACNGQVYQGFSNQGHNDADWHYYWHMCLDCQDIKMENYYWSQVGFFGDLEYECPFCPQQKESNTQSLLRGVLA